MQTLSFPYLLIPAVSVGLLAACGGPKPSPAPENAQIEPRGRQIPGQLLAAYILLCRGAGSALSISNVGQEAAQYISFEYYP